MYLNNNISNEKVSKCKCYFKNMIQTCYKNPTDLKLSMPQDFL